MKWLGVVLVAAVCLMLAGCAASPQQSPSPAPATGGEQPPAVQSQPQNVPPAPGNNATPPAPPSVQAPPAPTQPAAPSGLPDLQLQAITFDNPASLYRVMNGSITNYNSGTAPSPATKTAFYIDSVLIGSVDVPAMQPGATSTVGITFVCPSAGGHTLSGMIDYEHLVTELDEQNNGRAVTFTCSA